MATTLSEVPFGSGVYVISDSQYKKYRQKEVEGEIRVLESRADSYEETAAALRKTVQELREEHKLLPEDKSS